MKLYLAGPFEQQANISRLALALVREGHAITSRWLTEHGEAALPAELARHARHDLEDIDAADAFVLVTGAGGNPRGGRHFETGYAYHAGKRLVIFGPKENVFHHLERIERARDKAELVRLLAR
jgi:nucleoside 2-deoxyribosyltransferase